MSNGNGNGQSEQWDEDDVRAVLLNPVYTTGSEPIVSDDDWIAAQQKLVQELGLNTYFEQLLTVIKNTFGDVVE